MDIFNTFFDHYGQNARASSTLSKYLLLVENEVALFRINANKGGSSRKLRHKFNRLVVFTVTKSETNVLSTYSEFYEIINNSFPSKCPSCSFTFNMNRHDLRSRRSQRVNVRILVPGIYTSFTLRNTETCSFNI